MTEIQLCRKRELKAVRRRVVRALCPAPVRKRDLFILPPEERVAENVIFALARFLTPSAWWRGR